MTSTDRLSSLARLLTRAARSGMLAGACATLMAAGTPLASQERARDTVRTASAQPALVDREVKADTPDATRAELTALLEQALARASNASLRPADRTAAQADVAAIRRRLESGDFQAGDRFHLTVIADSLRRTEMIVREGPEVEFGALPALPLTGVLRSELQTAIHTHLKRFYRTPEVRVQILTRVLLSGAVQKPGTYAVPPDVLLSDVVMAGGGPTQNASPDKVIVTRNGREIVSESAYQRALKEGRTIEQIGVQSGDEIRIGERGRRNWGQIATIGMFSVSVFTAVLALIRSSYSD